MSSCAVSFFSLLITVLLSFGSDNGSSVNGSAINLYVCVINRLRNIQSSFFLFYTLQNV